MCQQIFSNANDAHVAKVLNILGLEDCFEEIITFESLNPKHNSNESERDSGKLKKYEQDSTSLTLNHPTMLTVYRDFMPSLPRNPEDTNCLQTI